MAVAKSDVLGEAVGTLRALADPVRLRLLSLLEGSVEVCVCHLHEALGLPQPTVSRHLAYLRREKLVAARKQGLWVYYRLARPATSFHGALLATAALAAPGLFAEDRRRLERALSCCEPEPRTRSFQPDTGISRSERKVTTMEIIDLKSLVSRRYGEVAEGTATCGSLCGCVDNADGLARAFGYTDEELASLPEGANLGLSCGNPQALAALAEGEVVVDLGSGAGFDALLAARRVGPKGRVIGVDMTDAMLEKARANAEALGVSGFVTFLKGEIEALPLENDSVDVVLSNCVLNLVPDKDQAFREVVRVLKPGGRLSVSDMAWSVEPEPATRRDLELIVGCIGGALVLDDYVARLERAGFREVKVDRHPDAARAMIEASGTAPPPGVEHLLSVNITAIK
ncbi:MAG: arsenite methyltransferase [Isosphaeraceae bacterium]